jgi:hypothetical protein
MRGCTWYINHPSSTLSTDMIDLFDFNLVSSTLLKFFTKQRNVPLGFEADWDVEAVVRWVRME